MTGFRDLSRARRVAVLASVDLLLLASLEVLARLLSPPPASPYEILTGLAVRIGLPGLSQALEADSNRFWAVRPGVPETPVEGEVGPGQRVRFTFSTTAEGLRTVPGPPGPRVVVCLGDSCTFGVAVDDAETFPARLQALLPGRRCLNAGVPGYSSFQGRLYLQERIGRWKPEAVTIAFGFNDAAVWGGRADSAERSAARPVLAFLLRSRLAQLAWGALPERPPGTPGGTRPRLTPDEYATEIRRMVTISREAGARPLLVLWPAREQVPSGARSPYQAALLGVARETGAELVDLVRAFSEAGGPGLFADVVHANAAGNAVAAARVAAVLDGAGTR